MSGKGNRGRSHGNRGRGQGPRRGQGNRGPNRTQGNRFASFRTAAPSASAANNGWTSVSRPSGPSNRGRTQGNRGRGAFRGGPSRGQGNRGSYYDRPAYATVEPAVVEEQPSYMASFMPKINTSSSAPLLRMPTFEEMNSGKMSWANLINGEVRPRNTFVSTSAAVVNVPVNVPVKANNGPAEGKHITRDGVEYITSATASPLNTSENAGSLKEWRVIKGDQTIPERKIVYTKQGQKLFYTKRPVYSVTPEGERIAYEGIWLPYIYIDTVAYTFDQFNEMMEEQAKFSREKKEIYDKQLFDRWKGASTLEEKRAIFEQREAKRKADAARYGKKYEEKEFKPNNAPFSDMCIQATRMTKDGSEPVCYDHQYQMVLHRLFDFIDENTFLERKIAELERNPAKTANNDTLIARYREQLNFVSRQINELDVWETQILNHVEEEGKELKKCHALHPGQEDVCLGEADPTIRGNISMYPNVANYPMPTGPVFKGKSKGGKRKTRKERKGKKGARKGTRKH